MDEWHTDPRRLPLERGCKGLMSRIDDEEKVINNCFTSALDMSWLYSSHIIICVSGINPKCTKLQSNNRLIKAGIHVKFCKYSSFCSSRNLILEFNFENSYYCKFKARLKLFLWFLRYELTYIKNPKDVSRHLTPRIVEKMSHFSNCFKLLSNPYSKTTSFLLISSSCRSRQTIETPGFHCFPQIPWRQQIDRSLSHYQTVLLCLLTCLYF